MRGHSFFLLCFIIIIAIPLACAHVPQRSGENDNIDKAFYIDEPLKSWVFYSELDDSDDARYYAIYLHDGDELRLSIITPETGDFSPNFVIMGEGMEAMDAIPPYIETREEYGIANVTGSRGDVEFEPFTPGAYSTTSERSIMIGEDGIYYVAVYEGVSAGSFALVVGYMELFSPIEMVRVPWDAVWIHRWEGQSYFMIFYPMALTILVGAFYLLSRMRMGVRPSDRLGWAIVAISFTYMGSGAMFINQIGIALSRSGYSPMMFVSAIFAFLPIVIGLSMYRYGFSERSRISLPQRSRAIFYGLLGLASWSGLIVFPALCAVIGLLPRKMLS
ncbi:MAG: hypothetical protein JW825_03085 [Candidatus Methanofastidiosa archaeon]|nr:hypothetical protein [Candidatus Methanofastidiosa archaeon]